MKRTILGLISFLTGTSMAYGQEIYQIKVSQLKSFGFNSETVLGQFREQHGINLGLNEELKVTEDQEGISINFETFDKLSVEVNASAAAGPYNKW